MLKFLYAFNNREVSPNLMLYEVARMNFSHFLVKDFDLDIVTFSNDMIGVSGLATAVRIEPIDK